MCCCALGALSRLRMMKMLMMMMMRIMRMRWLPRRTMSAVLCTRCTVLEDDDDEDDDDDESEVACDQRRLQAGQYDTLPTGPAASPDPLILILIILILLLTWVRITEA